MFRMLRLIDKVEINGSLTPLELFVLDLDSSVLKVVHRGRIPWNTRQRFRARQMLEVEKKEKWSDDFTPMDTFKIDTHMLMMRKLYTNQFLQVFRMGYENYFEGEWAVAQQRFMETLEMLGTRDGP